jgi:hypothetical protein
MFPDATGRPLHVTTGEPIATLLGDHPATAARMQPGGNLALVPGYSTDHLRNRGFEDDVPLVAVGSGKRLKGWQAMPLAETAKGVDFGVSLDEGPSARPGTGQRHAMLGFGRACSGKAGSPLERGRC